MVLCFLGFVESNSSRCDAMLDFFSIYILNIVVRENKDCELNNAESQLYYLCAIICEHSKM